MRTLFYLHSGLRYLVLLMGLVALVYFAYGLATKRAVDRSVRIIGSSFAGLLDTQVLMGIILLSAGWPFYPALWGHLTMMLLAAVVTHVLLVVNRRRSTPGYQLPLIAVVLAFVFIIGGILSINRSVMGTTQLGGG